MVLQLTSTVVCMPRESHSKRNHRQNLTINKLYTAMQSVYNNIVIICLGVVPFFLFFLARYVILENKKQHLQQKCYFISCDILNHQVKHTTVEQQAYMSIYLNDVKLGKILKVHEHLPQAFHMLNTTRECSLLQLSWQLKAKHPGNYWKESESSK